MNLCITCKQKLTTQNTYFSDKNQTKLATYCKKCFSTYIDDRYIAKKLWAIQYLGGKCKSCNNTFPYPLYDFHHRDPLQKEFVWTKIRTKSETEMKKELDKCDLLCANCHRLQHFKLENLSIEMWNPQQPLRKYYCKCGYEIWKGSKTCQNCRPSLMNWPSLEEMKILIWKMPINKLAEFMNRSDNAIHKFCKKHNLNKPPKGYWQKLPLNNNIYK